MADPITIQRWHDITTEKMNDLVSRQVLHGDHITLSRLELSRGAIVPVHSHNNEQISMVIAGVLLFVVNGNEMIVRKGEMLRIPGGVPHSVLAVEDAVAIDIFSPIREDWIRGDDAYLRGR